MELGKFERELYRRGTGAGAMFLLLGLFILVIGVFSARDSLGVLIISVSVVILMGIGIFEYSFKNDGLYRYENGLEIIHFKNKTKIAYSDIEFFSTKTRWKIASAVSGFILFKTEQHIYFSLKTGKRRVLFFPANSAVYEDLALYLLFKDNSEYK